MTKELEFETYLSISPSKFGIYLFDKKKVINLYNEELEIEYENDDIDLNVLNKFLENNIYKIEKLIGKFIKNIFVIIDSNKILDFNVGIKKKDYEKIIDKKYLENMLTEAKDLIKETYQEQKIIHIIMNNFLIDNNYYPRFISGLKSDYLCLEIQFISIPNYLVSEIDDILENYQIKIIRYLNTNYIKKIFNNEKIEISEMAYKIQSGFNENEVTIVPKNLKKLGFFEKFFQLFS